MHIELVVASGEEARARALLETAERKCIISNALRVPVALDARVLSGGALDRSA